MNLLEYISKIDKAIFLWLNQKHHPMLDGFMWFLSDRYVWFPFYIIIIGFLIFKLKKQGLIMVAVLFLMVLVADQFASGLIKPLVQRLRPGHDPEIAHLVFAPGGPGGKYGFISSHAANTFAFATFLFLAFYRKHKLIILFFPWAIAVTYSRIYNGVHFPGDLIAGAVTGVIWGILFFWVYQKIVFLKQVNPIEK